jgi:hypothetical protein
MKIQTRSIIFTLILAGLLAACQLVDQPGNGIKTEETPISTPQAGKASIKGIIVSAKDGMPFSNVAVRLAQVYRQGEEGAFVLDVAHSPGIYSDINGKFLIENFDPAEYLISVGEPLDNNYVIVSDNAGKPIPYIAAAGVVIDAGVLKVNYTP